MKLFNLVLFVLTLTIAATTSVLAADPVQETLTYESSFDNYKSFTNDNLSDWKSINVPSNGSGHAGHSMAGMQNQMSHEQIENMSPQSGEMSRMDVMPEPSKMAEVDPSDMKGMDHSQMTREHDTATMADMDHSKMTDIDAIPITINAAEIVFCAKLGISKANIPTTSEIKPIQPGIFSTIS